MYEWVDTHPDQEALALGVAVDSCGVQANVDVVAPLEAVGRLHKEPVPLLCVHVRVCVRRSKGIRTMLARPRPGCQRTLMSPPMKYGRPQLA